MDRTACRGGGQLLSHLQVLWCFSFLSASSTRQRPYFDTRLRPQRFPTTSDSAEDQTEVDRSRNGTKWAMGSTRRRRRLAGSFRAGCDRTGSRVPTPKSWGTSAQRRGIRLHLSRVGRDSRRLLDSSSITPNRSHNTTRQLARTCHCRPATRPKQTTHWPRSSPSQQDVVALAGVAGKRCVGDKTCFESRRLLPSTSATARHNGRERAASHRHEGIGALDREEHSRDRSAAGNQAGRELPPPRAVTSNTGVWVGLHAIID